MSSGNEIGKAKAGRRAYGRAESATANVGDPQLRELQTALGNDGMRRQMDQGRADRSIMLAHVTDRLNIMSELQGREAAMLGDRGAQYDWWRDAAKSGQNPEHQKMTAPDPNRWHEAAEAYRLAATSLAEGDIGQGRRHLEAAMQVEDRAMDGMSDLVGRENLEDATRPDSGFLDGLVEVGQVEPCDIPEALEVAEKILSLRVEVPDIPRLKAKKPWWAEEEEEDEEGDGAPPGGTDAGGA